MWRQGDIFIAAAKRIPRAAKPRPSLVLAEGELTGHAHRVEHTGTASVFVHPDGQMFVDVTAEEATVIHEEHGPITLRKGAYRIWRQREYTPEAIRVVRD